MKKIKAFMAIVILLAGAGCQDEQKTPETKIWGNGEPPGQWKEYFGNDNTARLNFLQAQIIDRHSKQIAELIKSNSKQHEIMGKSDIDLYKRVRKLEDPNKG